VQDIIKLRVHNIDYTGVGNPDHIDQRLAASCPLFKAK